MHEIFRYVKFPSTLLKIDGTKLMWIDIFSLNKNGLGRWLKMDFKVTYFMEEKFNIMELSNLFVAQNSDIFVV